MAHVLGVIYQIITKYTIQSDSAITLANDVRAWRWEIIMLAISATRPHRASYLRKPLGKDLVESSKHYDPVKEEF